MTMTFTNKITKTTALALLALGASYQSGFAVEFSMVANQTQTMATLQLNNNASVVAYTDNTFGTTYAAGSGTSLATIQASDVAAASGNILTLSGTKLSLFAGSTITGDADFSINITPQASGGYALPAANASYQGARFATVAALNTYLGNYLSSNQTVTNFGNIQINSANVLDLLVTDPSNKTTPTSVADFSGKILTNFPLTVLLPNTVARKAFQMLTASDSTLLRAESLDDHKSLGADVTLDIAGYAFNFNSKIITGNNHALTITSTGAAATVTFDSTALAGEFTSLNVAGTAIIDSSFANFTTGGSAITTSNCPVVVSGTAKFRCKVPTTFGNVTLG